MRPIPPDIKFENGDVANLEEIKDWIVYNVLEYSVTIRNLHFDKKLSREDKLWLVVLSLATSKEVYIKELMNKPPPTIIIQKEIPL